MMFSGFLRQLIEYEQEIRGGTATLTLGKWGQLIWQ